MKVVKYDDAIDTSAYPKYLQTIKSKLPPGALAFAADKKHHDFYSSYCVHDLEFHSITVSGCVVLNAVLQLQKNEFKHEKDLIINYETCLDIVINFDKDTKETKLDDLMIDEVSLDEPTGMVIHEMQFVNGTIRIVCKELIAQWCELQKPKIYQ